MRKMSLNEMYMKRMFVDFSQGTVLLMVLSLCLKELSFKVPQIQKKYFAKQSINSKSGLILDILIMFTEWHIGLIYKAKNKF